MHKCMCVSTTLHSLNRAMALHNIQQICPSFAPILINTYQSAADLFIAGDTLLSEEGFIFFLKTRT